MPSRAHLDWNGDRLIEHVRRAVVEALNETVDQARDDAIATHTWLNDPRFRVFNKGGRPVNPSLELQIRSEHATVDQPNPTARFGYTKRRGFYGLFHEEGTVREHSYPALRPAADRAFPTAVARLAEKLRRLR